MGTIKVVSFDLKNTQRRKVKVGELDFLGYLLRTLKKVSTTVKHIAFNTQCKKGHKSKCYIVTL